jgi:hypothetical protein
MNIYVIMNEKNQFFTGIHMSKSTWVDLSYGKETVEIFHNEKLANAWAYELRATHKDNATVKRMTLCQ